MIFLCSSSSPFACIIFTCIHSIFHEGLQSVAVHWQQIRSNKVAESIGPHWWNISIVLHFYFTTGIPLSGTEKALTALLCRPFGSSYNRLCLKWDQDPKPCRKCNQTYIFLRNGTRFTHAMWISLYYLVLFGIISTLVQCWNSQSSRKDQSVVLYVCIWT